MYVVMAQGKEESGMPGNLYSVQKKAIGAGSWLGGKWDGEMEHSSPPVVPAQHSTDLE